LDNFFNAENFVAKFLQVLIAVASVVKYIYIYVMYRLFNNDFLCSRQANAHLYTNTLYLEMHLEIIIY